MTFDWKKLHKELDRIRKAHKLSWRKMAKTCGVTASVFTRISKGQPVSVDNLAKLMAVGEWQFYAFIK